MQYISPKNYIYSLWCFILHDFVGEDPAGFFAFFHLEGHIEFICCDDSPDISVEDTRQYVDTDTSDFSDQSPDVDDESDDSTDDVDDDREE